ncbi:MAG: hypothetical protein JSV32_06510 [Dehalococcoidia bacterium]|nr:MAG: hypothetical protein JSV32_06510 [Dehalococcoidia bacterium]
MKINTSKYDYYKDYKGRIWKVDKDGLEDEIPTFAPGNGFREPPLVYDICMYDGGWNIKYMAVEDDVDNCIEAEGLTPITDEKELFVLGL